MIVGGGDLRSTARTLWMAWGTPSWGLGSVKPNNAGDMTKQKAERKQSACACGKAKDLRYTVLPHRRKSTGESQIGRS